LHLFEPEFTAQNRRNEEDSVAVAKYSEEELLGQLTQLFREYGFEGTSLSKICDVTGLVKASLYHRFPKGKDEMADTVLARADRIFAEQILRPLREPGDPKRRLAEVCAGLDKFYASGSCSCLLDTLTLSVDARGARKHARKSLQYWVASFAALSKEAGLPAELARQRGEDAVAAIQGALVVARVAGDRKAFRRALESLPERLLRK